MRQGLNVVRLRAEHRRLERRLEEMEQITFLSPSEQLERRRLQKQKLAIKDQLARATAGPQEVTPAS